MCSMETPANELVAALTLDVGRNSAGRNGRILILVVRVGFGL